MRDVTLPGAWVERITRHLGGTRVLALPALRALAVLAAVTWLALAPASFPRWHALAGAVAAFTLYSLAIFLGLWLRPRLTLGLNLYVLLLDLTFALWLIHLTGGAPSALFLALLLIAGLQSYYYGLTRGVLVASGSAAAYLAVIWPTIGSIDVADLAIRVAVLLGTAVGVGLIGEVEEQERSRVAALTLEAQQRERFIRSVVDSLREGVAVLDPAGRVVGWNPAMETRYGIAAAEVLGRGFLDRFRNLQRGPVAGALERLLRGEVEEFALDAVEHETLRKGRVVLNVRGSLLRQEGVPAGAVLLVEDITERVALERSARQAEKLAALGTLAAGLAHELNNPIGIISSRIELMLIEAESRGLPQEVRDDLAVLHRHAQRVAGIAQGLLSFARQGPGGQGPVDLNHLVEETLFLVEKQIVKDGVTLTRRLASGLPPVRGDANALQQVVMNLLTNARDALDGSGEIIVETAALPERPGAVRLVVRDTGPGIPAEVLPRIFDPFFTTKPAGTGLGLSISYGIVREHQGTVDVESRPGAGTTFTLTFPVLVRGGPA